MFLTTPFIIAQNQETVDSEFEKAYNSGKDFELMKFIVSHLDHKLALEAEKLLQGYSMEKGPFLIEKDKLPITWVQGTYPCGVDLAAFSKEPIFNLRGQGAYVGNVRMVNPNEGFLRLYDWTNFDGYIVYGNQVWAEAWFRRDGLFFKEGSIIFIPKE